MFRKTHRLKSTPLSPGKRLVPTPESEAALLVGTGTNEKTSKDLRFYRRPAYNHAAQVSSSPAAQTKIKKTSEQFAVYRPNFCCECGNKLIRLRWHIWTSRRFCDVCARRFRKERFVPVLITLLALFSSGYLLGRTRRPTPPPLIIERRSDSPLNDSQSASSLASTPGTAATTAATTIEADVYICGARTKKGTPCSRRVHGPVRCWQHKGMPAMLKQEKLLVKG